MPTSTRSSVTEPHDESNAAAAFRSIDRADWNARLVRDEKERLQPVIENVVSILLNDERWADVIALDEFSGQTMKRNPPPFERGAAGEWTDMDESRLELWLAQVYGLRKLKSETLFKGVSLAADANRYHQVRDYLDGVQWDGTPRLAAMLWAWFSAPRTDYVEKVAIKWMVGAVARVYRPGVKMDNVLILEGTQGMQKSSALKALFDPWFTDAGFEIGSADGYQIIQGMWCVELAELDGFNRADTARAKAFFTRTIDRFRAPYGRRPLNVPRQGVFAGSVNLGTYLKDDTGNRRYWPVTTGLIGVDHLRKDRDQLWAEAVHMYRQGVEWWVRASDRSLYEQEQEARYIGDAWETRIGNWLDTPDAGGMKPEKVTTADVLGKALHIDAGRWSSPEQARVGRIMSRLGWPRRKLGSRADRDYFYCRPCSYAGCKEPAIKDGRCELHQEAE